MRKLKQLIVLLLLLGPIALSAQKKSPLVTLSVKNQPLKEVFRSIQSQTGLNIMVTEKILSEAKKVSLTVKDMPLEQALEQCFRNTDLTYDIVEGTIIVKKKTEAANVALTPDAAYPDHIVQGRVINKSGAPLAGATVSIKGKPSHTFTDERGAYAIPADKDDELIFTYVDFKPTQVKVKGRSMIDVILELNDKSMDVVTISTGYQRIERKYLTGSVTSLKMDSLMQPGLTTVDKMLEGRVPGMIYMQNSGQPGAAPKLRIRGTSTFLGSQEPLWVVDGIVQTDPINIPASRINDLDFVNLVGNAVSGINPNDIEQVDVLKDAAATALYGVRAANGVIVITTKRGKPGPPTINYSGSLSFTRRPRYTDRDVYMMNSKERVEASREVMDKQLPLYGYPEGYEKAVLDYYNGLIDYDTYLRRVQRAETMNTDWLKIITQDVISTNHNLRISGGNQQSRYFVSLGYTDDNGVIKGESDKRYTGKMGFDIHYKNVKAQFTISANKNNRRYVPQQLGIMNYAYGTSRAIPLHNEDGSRYFYPVQIPDLGLNAFSRPSFNVLNEMDHSGQTVDASSYTADANINYQLMPGLQFTAVLSYTSGQVTQRAWFDEKTTYVDKIRAQNYGVPAFDPLPFGGELQSSNARQTRYTVRGEIDLSKYLDLQHKHQVNAKLGAEASSAKNSSTDQIHRGYYPERGFSFALVDMSIYKAYAGWVANFGRPQVAEGLTNLVSGLLTTSYIYDEKYILSFSTRSDFSNAFGTRSNERFLPTWTVSGRWNMHKDILRHTDWVNMAAVRFSYGTQGNILPNQTPYTIVQRQPFDASYQQFVSIITSYPNPNLKWEKTNSYDLAIDFSLFNNKVNGSVGGFFKRTSDAFLNKQVSQMNGIPQYVVNGGTLENKGVEISLNFTPVNNVGSNLSKKGFIWRIDPQLGQVFNKLLNNSINSQKNVLVDPRSITYQSFLSGAVPVNGKSINTFYSYRFKQLNDKGVPVFYGLEPGGGDALLAKYANMGKEQLFQTIMVESGRREPVLQGSVSNYMGYRNWTLNFTFTYSVGNKVRLMRIASGNYGTYMPAPQQNLRKEFVNRWRNPGDELHTNIPGLFNTTSPAWWLSHFFPTLPVMASNYYQMYDDSDLRVVKGDYVKLQSVQLTYTFGAELTSRMRVKYCNMALAGSNLFTIANKALRGQDPAQSGISPSINLSIRPVYTFNINIGF
jgi:TonB-linked SusC/RagA family outer membrane protein